MSQPFPLFPRYLVAFNGKFLATMNFQMPDDGSFLEIRIFLENEFKWNVVVLLGFFRKNVLNVQKIGKCSFIFFRNLADKRAVGEDWIPVVIDNFTLHVVFDIFIGFKEIFGISQLIFL